MYTCKKSPDLYTVKFVKTTQKTTYVMQLKPISLSLFINYKLSVKITTESGIAAEKLYIISDSTEHAVLFIYI